MIDQGKGSRLVLWRSHRTEILAIFDFSLSRWDYLLKYMQSEDDLIKDYFVICINVSYLLTAIIQREPIQRMRTDHIITNQP